MHGKAFLLLFLVALYTFLFWIVYLLLARPLTFVELFMRRRYRAWGLSVMIDDVTKLKRRARMLGLLLAIFFSLHAVLVLGSLLRCGR